MDNVNVHFDNPVKIEFVNEGAAFVVGDSIVTNQSISKANLASKRVGDGVFLNHTQRVINIDKDEADLFVVNLNDFIQGMF